MELRARRRRLLLQLLLLVLCPAQAPAQSFGRQRLEAGAASGERLCGRQLVRTLVRLCGSPSWSVKTGEPAASGDDEHWPHASELAAADRDPPLYVDPKTESRKAHNPVSHCCHSGCTRAELRRFCWA